MIAVFCDYDVGTAETRIQLRLASLSTMPSSGTHVSMPRHADSRVFYFGSPQTWGDIRRAVSVSSPKAFIGVAGELSQRPFNSACLGLHTKIETQRQWRLITPPHGAMFTWGGRFHTTRFVMLVGAILV